MSDESARLRARRGDDGARVERDQARMGMGVLGFLDALVGKRIYVEGARINYRGTLVSVIRHGDGTPGGLVMRPCQRVSYFGKQGPNESYTYTHTNPRLVPWEMVHDVGEEGFAEGAWRGFS